MAPGKMTRITRGTLQSARTKKQQRNVAKSVFKSFAEKHSHQSDLIQSAALVTGISTVPVIKDLSQMPQNDTLGGRAGIKVNASSLKIKYQLIRTGGNAVLARVIIFRWKDDSVPNIDDILLPATTNLPRVYSNYDVIKRGQFNILYDKTHKVFNQIDCQWFERDIGLKDKAIYFNDAGLFGNHKIYVLTIGDQSNISGNPVDMNFYSHLRYYDA